MTDKNELTEVANVLIDRIVERWENDGWEYGTPYSRSQALDALYAIGAFTALADLFKMAIAAHGQDAVLLAMGARKNTHMHEFIDGKPHENWSIPKVTPNAAS